MSQLAVGCAVQYYSDSNSCWVDTVVSSVRATGEAQLQCKPGTWLTVEEQKTKLRQKTNTGAVPCFQPSVRSGSWAAEQALALGPRTANQLGARKAEELGWANVLDGVTSVHSAVEKLNSGSLPCSADFCVVYSASSQCHYILYRSGATPKEQNNAEAVVSLQRSLAEEKNVKQQLQIECAGLQAIQSSQEAEIARLKTQASQESVQLAQQMSARNAELETDLSSYKRDLEQARAALSAAHRELADMREAELRSSGAESNIIAELQKSLAEEIEHKTVWEKEVTNLQCIREGLEKQLKETNAEMDDLVNKLDIESAAKEELSKLLGEAEGEIRTLRDSSNCKELSSLNAELEREKKVSRSLADQVAVAEAEIGSLKDSIAKGVESEREKRLQAEQAQEQLLEANDVLGASRRSLETQLLEEKTQRAAIEAELENFKNKLETMVGD